MDWVSHLDEEQKDEMMDDEDQTFEEHEEEEVLSDEFEWVRLLYQTPLITAKLLLTFDT